MILYNLLQSGTPHKAAYQHQQVKEVKPFAAVGYFPDGRRTFQDTHSHPANKTIEKKLTLLKLKVIVFSPTITASDVFIYNTKFFILLKFPP